MKGYVLGFDGTAGAISGEDGTRFRFGKDDWREEKPPQARDQVDFVASGETATDIYRLKASLGVNLPHGGAVSDIVSGEQVQAARSYIAPRPQLLLAAVLLFASVFLNFIENGSDDDTCCTRLIGVPTIYAGLSDALATEADDRKHIVGPYTDFREQLDESRRAERAAGGQHLLSFVRWLSYALWLIPLGAGWIIYSEIKGLRRRGLERAVGLGAVAALATLPVLKFVLGKVAATSGGIVGYALSQAAQGTSLGSYTFGAFVIALCGAGLIGTGMGRISRTPGL